MAILDLVRIAEIKAKNKLTITRGISIWIITKLSISLRQTIP